MLPCRVETSENEILCFGLTASWSWQCSVFSRKIVLPIVVSLSLALGSLGSVSLLQLAKTIELAFMHP